MERRKIYGSIIGIIAFVILILGATYAIFIWSNTTAQRTNVNLTIARDLEDLIVYKQGVSILETAGKTLNASTDYSGGISATIEFWKKESVTKTIYGHLYMEILKMLSATDTEDANIAKTDTIKWALTTYSSINPTETLLVEGTFNGRSVGDVFALKENFELNNYQTFYKVYLWFDSNFHDEELSVVGELLSTEISAKATDYEITSVNAVEMVMNLSQGDSWDSGASGVYATNSYTDADGNTAYHDYRYVGANVNNYVSFNNDLYRIIGVFDSNSHGVEGKYLVKLIAANLLTTNSWGAYNSSATSGTYSSYKNDWTGNTTGVKANLNVLLNEYYFNKTNTSNTYGTCSNWTYYNSGKYYRTNDCSDIVGYGIDSSMQSYIEDATWYLYGYSGNGLSKQNFYLCERGEYSGCTSGNSGAYDTSTTAKIGLMYVSDYMYASGYYSSTNTTTGSSSYYYGNQNWLYKGYEWTITPQSNFATFSFYVNDSGSVLSTISYNGHGVRPTFYLKSSVNVTGGDGTFSKPYILSI